MEQLKFNELKNAISGHAAALRCITEYQPSGGPGDKVFPPTYEGGKYATEIRLIDGQLIPCVLLDSVQSQANRMEMALLEAVRSERIALPLIETRFKDKSLLKEFTVTSLEAPHRIADAIFRDSLITENGNQVMFRKSEKGKILDASDVANATGLFGLCPTALVFGVWDSTGPRGGMGAKIQRAIVSEMVGLHAQVGCKTSSRIDPLQILVEAGPIYERSEKNDQSPRWTLETDLAGKNPVKIGKKGKPSEANHCNITPQVKDGGMTISKAIQTTVISLSAMRRLRFPCGESNKADITNISARTVLASLGLLAAVLTREEGADLRSRCQLVPCQKFIWELLAEPGEKSIKYELNTRTAIVIFTEAVKEAIDNGLPWGKTVSLTPHPELIKLVAKSQELTAHISGEEDE